MAHTQNLGCIWTYIVLVSWHAVQETLWVGTDKKHKEAWRSMRSVVPVVWKQANRFHKCCAISLVVHALYYPVPYLTPDTILP